MTTINACGNGLTGTTGSGAYVGATSPTITTPIIGQINDTNSNEILGFTTTSAAVNFINITNNSTGNNPIIAATGSDSNVIMTLQCKAGGQFNFASSTLANFVAITPASTTNPPGIVASGTDSNINLKLQSKGTGSVNLYDGNGNLLISAASNASAVNYTIMENASTGNNVIWYATGSDSNVNLEILCKGAGVPEFWTTANTPLELVSGTSYQHSTTFSMANTANARTVTFPDATDTLLMLNQGQSPYFAKLVDSNGNTMLNFSSTASAVNYITILNNATTGAPAIYAQGSDTNISMNIYTKATGTLAILSNTLANYFSFTPAAASSSPSFAAVGSDTNIILTLTGKGTGGVTLKGTTAADNAASGYVGETLAGTNATAVAMSTGSNTQINTLSLSAGDWDVWGVFYTTVGGTTTQSALTVQLNTSSATFTAPTTAQLTSIFSQPGTITTGSVSYIALPISRWNVSGSTTVYLNAQITYGTSTLTGNGNIYARRRR